MVREKRVWFLKTEDLQQNHYLRFALLQKIYNLCCLGFKQDKNEGFEHDVKRHVMEEDILCIVLKKEARCLAPSNVKKGLLGFVSYRTLISENTKIVYFSGVVVDPEFQGQGIASSVMKKIMEKEEVEWVGLRTQNPVMRKSLENICTEIFPALSGKNPPETFRRIGYEISQMLRMARYDARLMTEKETYGPKSLYGDGQIPMLKTDDLAIKAAFMKQIKGGDSMIVVGWREK